MQPSGLKICHLSQVEQTETDGWARGGTGGGKLLETLRSGHHQRQRDLPGGDGVKG